MRLDKFLKVSRLIKRRTLAKEISDQGRITINGNVAKAGTDVKVVEFPDGHMSHIENMKDLSYNINQFIEK